MVRYRGGAPRWARAACAAGCAGLVALGVGMQSAAASDSPGGLAGSTMEGTEAGVRPQAVEGRSFLLTSAVFNGQPVAVPAGFPATLTFYSGRLVDSSAGCDALNGDYDPDAEVLAVRWADTRLASCDLSPRGDLAVKVSAVVKRGAISADGGEIVFTLGRSAVRFSPTPIPLTVSPFCVPGREIRTVGADPGTAGADAQEAASRLASERGLSADLVEVRVKNVNEAAVTVTAGGRPVGAVHVSNVNGSWAVDRFDLCVPAAA